MIPAHDTSMRFLVMDALALNKKPKGIPMAIPTFGEEEIMEAIDSLLSQEVTMGKKVAQFEHLFAEYMGVKHAVMVNSGSSANLLMMSAVSNPMYGGRLMPGDEVIVPALTWSTTIWPVIQTGHMPILVDCDHDTLCIDVDKIEVTERTKAILCAHILGNGCNMDALTELADKHNLILLEDNCESLGSKYKGKQLGTFGSMGTFSFFFSHHITTIEGGMIVTNDDTTADILRSLRAHGWIRDMHNKPEQDPNLDPRFTFCNIGYSMKPTEIQGAFGIHQIQKLDKINKKREKASIKIRSNLAHLPIRFTKPEEGVEHTWFGFPIIYDGDRNGLIKYLNDRDIETRPVIAGNIARHPASKIFPHRCGVLTEADWITDHAFYISAHLDDDKIEYLTKVMREYFET